MKTATLLKVWTVLVCGWLLLFGPHLLSLSRERLTLEVAGAAGKIVWLLIVALGVALALHVLYRRGARRHSGVVDGLLVVDASPTRVLPGMAQFLTALGLTLLLGQAPRPACGGIVLGLLLTAFGAIFLRRETLRIEPEERRLWRSSHLLGYPVADSEVLLPERMPLRLEHLPRPSRGVALVIGEVMLADKLEHADALRVAEAVGPALGREVKDRTVQDAPRSSLHRGRHLLSRLPGIALLLALLILGVAWMVPAGRSALCRLAVAPSLPFTEAVRFPAVRAAAARCLAADPENEENLLALVKVANTADRAQSSEALEAAVSALRTLAGEAPQGAEGDAIGRINRWAARRLGRPLDAHDGVQGWYPVEGERFRAALDTMAGDDVEAAAMAWNTFGAGDLTNPEDFLWAAGPALADHRPLHFVLRHGNPLEALSESRKGHEGPVLAETVGEAVALQLWGYDGVGGTELPQDFWAWWNGYARARHLPPGGPRAR